MGIALFFYILPLCGFQLPIFLFFLDGNENPSRQQTLPEKIEIIFVIISIYKPSPKIRQRSNSFFIFFLYKSRILNKRETFLKNQLFRKQTFLE